MGCWRLKKMMWLKLFLVIAKPSHNIGMEGMVANAFDGIG